VRDGSADSFHGFVTDQVEPGTRVITDAWQGYHGLDNVHERHSQRAARARGQNPHNLLPTVHRVASLTKRWLLGTHQGSVDEAHLPNNLNEFVFRFNRRGSRSRGLVFYRILQLAVDHDPIRYRQLVATPEPKAIRPSPPTRRGRPPSVQRPPAQRPWRS
jgi:transposase-like protein